MFTGIIETMGRVKALKEKEGNLIITIEAIFAEELKIDQSVAHNGVCLTVVNCDKKSYSVVAIDETLKKSNLGLLKEGELVNLERCLRLGDRLDGHLVQGHVDQTAICISAEDQNGSWMFTFEYDERDDNMTVEKGSITVNGVSLTVLNSGRNTFSVAIIPYTLEHTNFKNIEKGSNVNLEFDIIGKYVQKIHSRNT